MSIIRQTRRIMAVTAGRNAIEYKIRKTYQTTVMKPKKQNWRQRFPGARWLIIVGTALLDLAEPCWCGAAETNRSDLLDLLQEKLPWDKPGAGLLGEAGDPDHIDFRRW
jgi:hypothetical protein